ncbi:MAG: CPBP family intramembrane glutamic endopeptidase [Syntrophobacteraceae bacterium]
MVEEAYFQTIAGLCIALFGPALLLSPSRRLPGKQGRMQTRVFELLFLWTLAGAIIGLVLCLEGLPLSSIGFEPRLRSVIMGLLLALFFNRAVAPFAYWMIRKMGAPGFEAGLAAMARMPAWFLIFAAITAGVVEEILYRGYAIERMAQLTGSYALAGMISTAVHALMHLPMWGWGPVATFFVSSGVLSIFYICTQDLTACIMAHTITDAVGFLTAKRAAAQNKNQ